ncbi:unnamed protein product, partial [Allacma fusca]
MFQERFINLKDSKGNLNYKKLTQYWTTFLGFAFWTTDKTFALSNHVRKYDYEDDILPRPCDEASLNEVIPQLLMLPRKPNTSHWEVLLVSEYRRKLKPENGEHYSLVIFRFDHALLDGKTPPEHIDMASTLAMPDHPGGANNNMRLFLTDLPLKCISSLDRLLVTNHVLRKRGADWSSFASLHAVELLGKFPLTICRNIFCSMYKTGPSYSLSILPSTSSREFIDNGEIVDVYTVAGTTYTGE